VRRRLALVTVAVLFGLLWGPVIKPAGQAGILILDIYSESLVGHDVARLVTPEPRASETRERIAGTEMRVDWWRPGSGDSHPGVLVVPGASALGNDNEALREFASSMARAGYLVMLPELPFLKEGRFDPAATAQLDGSCALLRGRGETRGRATGAFGISVGGGLLLVAAGKEPTLPEAAFISVLGAYHDMDTYLASVVGAQQLRAGRLVPWAPSDEARERLPAAAIDAVSEADREAAREALAAPTYEEALRRIRSLPPSARAIFDALSPETVWPRIRPPIFWIHDPADAFEPLAEAEAAAAAAREGRMVLVVPKLVQHAVAEAGEAKQQGPLFVLGELWQLLAFTFEVLRLAG
jgi:dienelactone hydrolase